MDVFRLREGLVRDYQAYVKGVTVIDDPRVREAVHHEFDAGLLWPDPVVQINPSFEPGPTIEELSANGTLHPTNAQIFRVDKAGKNLSVRLHKHQLDALGKAQARQPYVVTTGTGSGKSLTYIVPIVDHVLKNGSGKGIQAIIVYPMNALANSQIGELEKFLKEGFDKPPVTFRRYTGQEKEDERAEIMETPPDVILTNYVMLELVLTRAREDKLISAAQGLKFLVFDELHTYRGRQGSDVAMLIRRVKSELNAPELLTIGTSATLASDMATDPAAEVADVAGRIFGIDIPRENIIGETLRRCTPELKGDAAATLRTRLEKGHKGAFRDDPLSSWIETTLGLASDKNGRLVRARPLPITGKDGAGQRLADLTGIDQEQCITAIRDHLMASYRAAEAGDEAAKAFAFRLHQFITRGGTPYVTLEPPASRYITLNGQATKPDDRNKPLYPLVFCRECGKEYLTAWNTDEGFAPRHFFDKQSPEGYKPVYLYIDEKAWPDDNFHLLPPEWKDESGKLRSKRDEFVPRNRELASDGTVKPGGLGAAIIPTPFRFCLKCGASYNFRNRSDYTKLVSLEAEARSSATTILTLSALNGLQTTDLAPEARKLLSFTDNRQDASLQAGHFNDFRAVGVMRSGLAAALQKHPKGLATKELPDAILEALKLDVDTYALEKDLLPGPAEDARRTMKDVITYRVLRDLERGWRVTSPNLEQAGLLRVEYPFLDDILDHATTWQAAHESLRSATRDQRRHLLTVLLDHMRRELCIRHDILRRDDLEELQRASGNQLTWEWAIDEDETLRTGTQLVPGTSAELSGARGQFVFLGPTSNFGLYLKQRLPEPSDGWNGGHVSALIHELLLALRKASLVHQETIRGTSIPGYRIAVEKLIWKPGDGTAGAVDVLRTPTLKVGRTNPFFVNYYREKGTLGVGMRAKEHTAQVPPLEREEREKEFRSGVLPLMFCSPTMELGVDIAQLNVVNMRNVPPTPANYAQRSGRAGRSGQPALVFTYCSRSSPHDQYFFRRSNLMVRGSVTPPRIDLSNEDLVRSHVHAIWLKQSDLDLGSNLGELVETEDLDAGYLDTKQDHLNRLENREVKERSIKIAQAIVDQIPEIINADWYNDKWVSTVINGIGGTFEKTLERWRNLVRAAKDQARRQGDRILQAGGDDKLRKQAQRLQREAQAQIGVLMNSSKDWQGDFYPYRYFASEGFLPGYNFPRLPLSAFIPGRRGTQDNFLNRPRFVAISEFGPRSVIYHEGSKYRIIKAQQPPSPDGDSDGVVLEKSKICEDCGHFHVVDDIHNAEVCENCKSTSLELFDKLYRMSNVTTKRVQHISSDEEERRRMGFEIRTATRFNDSTRMATVKTGEKTWGTLRYTPSADIWQINVGERRRRVDTDYGYHIDLETGMWASREVDDEDENDSALSKPMAVVPYVQDTTNTLLITPTEELDRGTMASLQAALKSAIQAVYYVEDRELRSEALPNMDERRSILLFEDNAGGAGVLRHLARDPNALKIVAETALDILHFDPDGTDRGKDARGELCGQACYDCLLSYMNQRDHRFVDRHLVRDILLELKAATIDVSNKNVDRATHFSRLMGRCDWASERDLLQLFQDEGCDLPTDAQKMYEKLGTLPDFSYENARPPVFVYADGYVHEEKQVKLRDERVERSLKGKGIRFIRFKRAKDEDKEAVLARWRQQIRDNRDLFGGKK